MSWFTRIVWWMSLFLNLVSYLCFTPTCIPHTMPGPPQEFSGRLSLHVVARTAPSFGRSPTVTFRPAFMAICAVAKHKIQPGSIASIYLMENTSPEVHFRLQQKKTSTFFETQVSSTAHQKTCLQVLYIERNTLSIIVMFHYYNGKTVSQPIPINHMCWGLNSHWFLVVGDVHQPNSRV